METNVVGTCTLLDAALGYWRELSPVGRLAFRFLHVSTDEVFGSLSATGEFTEATAYDPHSPYAASKAAADHFVRAYFQTYGLPVLVTHCSNNYGPYQYPEKLIPVAIHNALAGRPIPIYGDGQHIRDWLFVADHCRALEQVLDRAEPGNTFNIGGNCQRTNLEIVTMVCRLMDALCPDLPHPPLPRPDHVCAGPPRERPPLCHGCQQDSHAVGVGAPHTVLRGNVLNRRVVFKPSGLVENDHRRRTTSATGPTPDERTII